MDEKNLLNVSIVCAIIGIVILLFMQVKFEPKTSKIKDLKMEEFVKITGKVVSKRQHETITILKVDDGSGEIEVFLDKKINFPKNMEISIEGKVTEYKGRKQITANQIKIIQIG